MSFFIKCRKCGSIYSSKMKFCSECHANKPFIYSNFIRIYLPCLSALAIIVLTITGGTILTKNKKNDKAMLSNNKSYVYGLNQTAEFKNDKITANYIEESKGFDNIAPKIGNIFIGINFTIENTSNRKITINSSRLFKVFSDNVQKDYSENAHVAFNNRLDGTLKSGKKITGYYAVEVPENWSTLSLQINSLWITNLNAKFNFYNSLRE